MTKKWFQKAVESGRTKNLGCWSKNKSPIVRRRCALQSRPSNWGLHKKRLSAARALQALANVTQDKPTKREAQVDANYFYRQLK